MHQLTNYEFTEENSVEMLQDIIKNKHDHLSDGSVNIDKLTLIGAKKTIVKEYKCYYENKSLLYKLRPSTSLNNSQKDAMTNAYIANPSLISRLRKKYVNESCPYCSVGMVKQLDHYLPKKKFPEFALLDINLVPCCPDCNEKKGDLWNKSGYTIFNPYIHKLPDQQIIKAKLDIHAYYTSDSIPAVEFYIDDTKGGDKDTIKLLRSHCQALNLITENGHGAYMDKAAHELQKILNVLKNNYELELKRFNPDDAMDHTLEFLEEQINDNIIFNGINNWETALWCAVKDSKDYLLDFFDVMKELKLNKMSVK